MGAVHDHGRPRVDHRSRLRHAHRHGHRRDVVPGRQRSTSDAARHRFVDWTVTVSSTSSLVAALRRCPRGCPPSHPGGWPASPPRSSIPTPVTPGAWPTACHGLGWWSITSTPCAWPTRPSTRSAAASSRRPLGHRGRKGDPLYRIRRRLLTAHDRLGPRPTSAWWCSSRAATPMARWVPTWPRSCCATCTPRCTHRGNRAPRALRRPLPLGRGGRARAPLSLRAQLEAAGPGRARHRAHQRPHRGSDYQESLRSLSPT